MYCYKCGKYTETDETLCPECKAQQNQAQPQVVVPAQTTEQITNVKAPTNKAGIIGLVMGIVALILTLVAFVFADLGVIMMEEGGDEAGYMASVVALVMQIAAVAPIVLSLVFGVKGIKNFKKAGRLGTKRPIPGFVMGIAGIPAAGISIIYGFLTFILAIIGLSV